MSQQQRTALGKGLSSLLPAAPHPSVIGAAAASAAVATVSSVSHPPSPAAATATSGSAHTVLPSQGERLHAVSVVNVDDIVVNPYQPRREFDEIALQELANSIRANGVIQPLIVRKSERGLQLIAGERRLRASKIAGLKQVPVVIRRSTDREALEVALIENIQRQDLNCVDEALAYFQLAQEFGLTQEEIAKQVGKERATVANFLRILKLPEPILEDLKSNILTFGHAKALMVLEENEQRLRLRLEIIDRSLNVRETEKLAAQWKISAPEAHAGATLTPPKTSLLKERIQQLALDLTRSTSTRVEIKGNDRRGKIVLHYQTREELDRLILALQNQKQ